MAGGSRLVVPAVAVLSVLVSAVASQVAEGAGHGLPSETGNLAVIGAGAAAMAVLLHRRTPTNNLWRVLLVIALNGPLAVVLYSSAAATAHPPEFLVAALWLLDVVLAIPWVLVAGLFPDGHRPAGAWPRLVALGVLLLGAVSVAAWLTAPTGAPVPVPGHLPGTLPGSVHESLHDGLARTASWFTGLLPLAALAGLAVRYRRSGPVIRQQIRVGFAGLATSIVLEVLLRLLKGAQEGRLQFAGTVVAVGVGQLAFAAALLRWRLWVVDQALPRAVVLGSCSAAFTGLIVAGALLVTGDVRTSQLRVAVVAAAVVTALVQGYSRRLEPWVRRLVYGERPSGFGVLVGLADGLTALDDQTAAERVAEAARRGLAVPWAALWTSTARRPVYRLLATAGEVVAETVMRVEDAEVALTPQVRLVGAGSTPAPWPGDTGALAVLGGASAPWGLLAVGQRRGDPLTAADLELLTAIARESELARANRLLTDQVAASVEELKARAVALQVSRQRLVAAQDAERRRIERDLHDGAQHDLITLAGELRQLARPPSVDAPSPESPSVESPSPDSRVVESRSADSRVVALRSLEDLAGRAEAAVFALQDLARGIYPSVLTDHGITAAVRSFAGRLPLDVVLDVAPTLARRRWPSAVEVALYFVAIESLGNSRKHAAATRTTVTLVQRDGELVLEVYDDGRGFDVRAAQSGSGLQHMADRMAALGGRLVVEGRPGAGTWVLATVPVDAVSLDPGPLGAVRPEPVPGHPGPVHPGPVHPGPVHPGPVHPGPVDLVAEGPPLTGPSPTPAGREGPPARVG